MSVGLLSFISFIFPSISFIRSDRPATSDWFLQLDTADRPSGPKWWPESHLGSAKHLSDFTLPGPNFSIPRSFKHPDKSVTKSAVNRISAIRRMLVDKLGRKVIIPSCCRGEGFLTCDSVIIPEFFLSSTLVLGCVFFTLLAHFPPVMTMPGVMLEHVGWAGLHRSRNDQISAAKCWTQLSLG